MDSQQSHIYQVLDSIARDSDKNEFILKNIHLFRQFADNDGICTPELANAVNKVINPERESKRISAGGLLRRCPHCSKLGTVQFLDTKKSLYICRKCGHIYPRFEEGETAPLIRDGTDRSSFSSAELRIRHKSIYSPFVHMQSWMLRMCGVELVYVRPDALKKIDAHLVRSGFRGKTLMSRDKIELATSSYSWWFKTLKILGLSVYYNCINYFIRLYGPDTISLTMPVFTVQEQAYILSRFRDALDLFSKMRSNLFPSSPRRNFFHYGIFLYHLLLYSFPPKRSTEFFWAYPYHLQMGHSVKDVQRKSGKAFSNFFYTFRISVLNSKPFIRC